MPAELWERMKHKAVRPIVQVCHFEGPELDENSLTNPESTKMSPHVIAIGEIDPELKSHRCPFLTYDLKCNIYEDRPFVCREFGKESHLMMKCCYQDKEGRVRSRQEIRAVNRSQCKGGDVINQRIVHDNEGKMIQLTTRMSDGV
jgi:Fe-S-cluster containining protein